MLRSILWYFPCFYYLICRSLSFHSDSRIRLTIESPAFPSDGHTVTISSSAAVQANREY